MVGEELFDDALFEGNTFFLAGGASNYILPEDESMIKHHFPKAQIEVIPNVGHWVHAEAPKEFYELISKFLLRN